MRRRTSHLLGLAVASAAMLSTLACSDSKPTAPQAESPIAYPQDTPEATVQSLAAAYAARDLQAYARLFTGDFTFEFSDGADPDLVQRFESGWVKADELQAAENLFQGGPDAAGVYRDRARSIELVLTPVVPRALGGDPPPTVPRALITAMVHLRIGMPDELAYVIGETPQAHDFYLIRGDAALGLTPDQPTDAEHWYVQQWFDLSPPLEALATAQNDESTWGRLKGLYR